MPEHDVETTLVNHTLAMGGRALKWVSPGLRAVPDRIVLFPRHFAIHTLMHLYDMPREVATEVVEVVRDCSVRFVETKDWGKKPRPGQSNMLDELKGLGFMAEPASSNPAAREMSNPLAKIKHRL